MMNPMTGRDRRSYRVLVTGAAGGVGHRVCGALRRAGFDVRGLVPPGDDARRLELSPEDLCVGHVEHPEVVDRAMAGVQAVVHCAALLPDALGRGAAAFHAVNVEGTRNVMAHAIIHRLERVIAMSTISVVDHVTRAITPSSLLEYVAGPTDPYLASKIEAERLLLEMSRGLEGAVQILRLAYVYGPGNFAVWRQPLRLLQQGRLRLVGDGAAPLPLLYADDLARFVATALGEPPAGKPVAVHVLANPQRTTVRAVFDAIADQLRVPRPRSVPVWAARWAAGALSRLPARCRPGRLGLLTPARVLQFSRGYDLDAVLDRDFATRIPLTDYRDGLRRMVEDYLARERPGAPR
jgi:nucleoside-diphosphate-sugar epimerase